MSDPALAALVSARLCHDLISPIGAIGNGLELLQMSEGRGGGPEHALISESLGTALARLRFYRVAFGPADFRARQSFDEARQISDEMFHGRFDVDWSPQTEDTMPRAVAQLAYLAILCFERSLPLGGAVRVSAGRGTIALVAENCRVVAPAELWAHVTSGARLAEPNAENVQFPLLRRAMVARGYRAERRFTDSVADLRLIAPAVSQAIPA